MLEFTLCCCEAEMMRLRACCDHMNLSIPNQYIGRFAPSPSGPLHLGSLVAALGSWLDTRHHQGAWRVRIEDLDTPRNQPGAESSILRCLEAHGLYWEGPVIRQSDRLAFYEEGLEQLSREGWIFPCACSRREVEEQGGMYPGTCRKGLPAGRTARTLRIHCPHEVIYFQDAGFGAQQENLAEATGDFILKRADGIFSYQLAVVMDDHDQGVTHVVRGADLLSSTARQIFLGTVLGYPTPHYFHLPLVKGANGQKLSKQNHAPALDLLDPLHNIFSALHVLKNALVGSLQEAPSDTLPELLKWAVSHWQPPRITSSTLNQSMWDADTSELRHDRA